MSENKEFNIFNLAKNNNNSSSNNSDPDTDEILQKFDEFTPVSENSDNYYSNNYKQKYQKENSNDNDNDNNSYNYDYDYNYTYNRNNKRIRKETKTKQGKKQKISNTKNKNKGKLISNSSSSSRSNYDGPLFTNGSKSSSIPSSTNQSSNENYFKKKSKNKTKFNAIFKNNSDSFSGGTSTSSISSDDSGSNNNNLSKKKKSKNNKKLEQQHIVFGKKTILNTQKKKRNEKKLEIIKLNEFSKFVNGMKKKIEENNETYPQVAKIYEHHLKGWQRRAISSDGILNNDPDKLLYIPFSYSRHIEFENGMNDIISNMEIDINDVSGCFGCNSMAFFNGIIKDIQIIEQTKNLTFLMLKALENSSVVAFYNLVPNLVETYCREKFKKKASNIEWNVIKVYIHFNFHMSNFCTVFKLKKELEKMTEYKCYLEGKLATLNVAHIERTENEKIYLSQPQKDNNSLYFKYDEVIEKKERQYKDELINLYNLYKSNEDTILNSNLKNDTHKIFYHQISSQFFKNF